MHCEAAEQDMVDMFRALPKDEVPKAFEWGAGRLRHRLRSAQTFFSLSKDGEKKFDHIGKSTVKMFLVTTIDMLRRFVKYDIRDNNLFLLDQIVLQQGSSGVPIGGFLSAQLAELWALWKEVLALGGGTPSRSTECTWNTALRRDCTRVCTGTIGVYSVPFPYPDISGPLKFSESQLLNLPEDSPVAKAPIWEPVDSRVASVHLGDVEVPIVVTAPWDGSSGGRAHTILRFIPRHSRAAARTFLKGYEVLRDVVNECLHPQPQIHADCP